jgi:Uma2 family endonuclease
MASPLPQSAPDLIDSLPERRFTVAEFDSMIAVGIFAEDEQLELVEGKIVPMSPVGPLHNGTMTKINQWFVDHRTSTVNIINQGPLRLTDGTQLQPDLMVVAARPDFYARANPRPPDVLLLIEVSDSTLVYDRRTKLLLYAHEQIPEVWIVNLTDDLIEVYSDPGESGYRTTRLARRGEVITPTALPSINTPVDDLII